MAANPPKPMASAPTKTAVPVPTSGAGPTISLGIAHAPTNMNAPVTIDATAITPSSELATNVETGRSGVMTSTSFQARIVSGAGLLKTKDG